MYPTFNYQIQIVHDTSYIGSNFLTQKYLFMAQCDQCQCDQCQCDIVRRSCVDAKLTLREIQSVSFA